MNPSLWLIHRAGAGTAAERTQFRAEAGGAALVLETCLRRLALGTGAPPPLAGELFTGSAAYRQLLEVVTGLQSAVAGETNVAGQFRRAWIERLPELTPAVSRALAPVVAAVFADAAVIRDTHLTGLGGSSWGTLVRRLLGAVKGTRVLVIGAGDLAAAVAPCLRQAELGLWNRRAVTGDRRRPFAGVARWFDPAAADAAAAWAQAVVITTPADVAHDGAWLARFAARATPLVAGIHLGQREPTAFRWPGGTRGHLLDDVLALARQQQQRRGEGLARARRHCAELAAGRYGDVAPDAPVRAAG